VQWEGQEAHPDLINAVHDDEASKDLLQPPTPPPALSPSESEEDPDSEDEYVAESETVRAKRPFRVCSTGPLFHACLLIRAIYSAGRATRKLSTSYLEEKGASPHLKRKSGISHQAREPKRKKSSDVPFSVDDDPARKYCLGKLRDMLRPVFR